MRGCGATGVLSLSFPPPPPLLSLPRFPWRRQDWRKRRRGGGGPEESDGWRGRGGGGGGSQKYSPDGRGYRTIHRWPGIKKEGRRRRRRRRDCNRRTRGRGKTSPGRKEGISERSASEGEREKRREREWRARRCRRDGTKIKTRNEKIPRGDNCVSGDSLFARVCVTVKAVSFSLAPSLSLSLSLSLNFNDVSVCWMEKTKYISARRAHL